MHLNADFTQAVLLHAPDIAWSDSPMPGVSRRPLDRIGAEVARATTIVRYAPGSHFSAHVHAGGEEFIVLEGVFQDEHGDYPVGSYVRNPPTSSHTPGSEPGCVIFVKLWQFDPQDRTPVRVMMDHPSPLAPGIAQQDLFRDAAEHVRLLVLDPGAAVDLDTDGGAEVLALDGSLCVGPHELRAHSWLRLPDGAPARAVAGPQGARIWLKSGHLRVIRQPGG